MKNQKGAALLEYSSTLATLVLIAATSINLIGFEIKDTFQTAMVLESDDLIDQMNRQEESPAGAALSGCGGGTGSNCDGEKGPDDTDEHGANGETN